MFALPGACCGSIAETLLFMCALIFHVYGDLAGLG